MAQLDLENINIRLLRSQFDRFMLESVSYDIIVISETWLASDLPDKLVGIPGLFSLGGVALYVKDSLGLRIESKYTICLSSVEQL